MCYKKHIKAIVVLCLCIMPTVAFCVKDTTNYKAEFIDHYIKEFPNFLIGEIPNYFSLSAVENQEKSRLDFDIYLSNIIRLKNYEIFEGIKNFVSFSRMGSEKAYLASQFKYLGLFYFNLGNIEKAKLSLEKGLEEFEDLDDSKEKILMLKYLSRINFILNDYSTALEKSNLAISLSEGGGAFYIQELFWRNNILIFLNKNKASENDLIRNILAKATRYQSTRYEWECYYQLGKSYLQQKLYTQAKWFFVQALSLTNQFKNPDMKIRSLLMLAQVKYKINDISLALSDLSIAKSIAPAKSSFLIDIYRRTGLFKNSEKAKENYNLALSNFKSRGYLY